MVIGVSDNMYFVNSATPPMDILEALYNDGKCTVVGNLKHAEDVLRWEANMAAIWLLIILTIIGRVERRNTLKKNKVYAPNLPKNITPFPDPRGKLS